MDALIRYTQTIPPSQWCQAYFVLLGAGCLALQLMPGDIQHALLQYGARKSQQQQDDDDDDDKKGAKRRNLLVRLLDGLMILRQVPHAWFSHFYVTLVGFQLFWAVQFVTQGRAMMTVAGMETRLSRSAESMDIVQLVTVWAMLLVQGLRRIWECTAVMKPSKSPMLAIHWIMTMIFYFDMTISVWIEGSATIVAYPSTKGSLNAVLRSMLLWYPFYLVSITQHRCHKHLASLPKYSLPQQGLFKRLVCPHYTMECLVYLILAVAAAPRGHILNRTLLAGLFFVVANLGATAANTKAWYSQKFGSDKLPTWRMVPFIF